MAAKRQACRRRTSIRAAPGASKKQPTPFAARQHHPPRAPVRQPFPARRWGGKRPHGPSCGEPRPAPMLPNARRGRSVKAGVPLATRARTPASGGTGAAWGAKLQRAAPYHDDGGRLHRLRAPFSAMSAKRAAHRGQVRCISAGHHRRGRFRRFASSRQPRGDLFQAVQPHQNTSVPCSAASASRDSGSVSPVCAVWPVMTWKLRLAPGV